MAEHTGPHPPAEPTRQRGARPRYAAGFAHALKTDKYDVVVQMDADGSHAPPTSTG